jgi:hypothetical protein
MAVSTMACGAGMGARGVGAGTRRRGVLECGLYTLVLQWTRMEVGRERPYMTPRLTIKAECSMAWLWLLLISVVLGLYGA